MRLNVFSFSYSYETLWGSRLHATTIHAYEMYVLMQYGFIELFFITDYEATFLITMWGRRVAKATSQYQSKCTDSSKQYCTFMANTNVRGVLATLRLTKKLLQWSSYTLESLKVLDFFRSCKHVRWLFDMVCRICYLKSILYSKKRTCP